MALFRSLKFSSAALRIVGSTPVKPRMMLEQRAVVPHSQLKVRWWTDLPFTNLMFVNLINMTGKCQLEFMCDLHINTFFIVVHSHIHFKGKSHSFIIVFIEQYVIDFNVSY